jgi:hypothetical protein
MSEIMVILERSIAKPDRDVIMRVAPPTQSISSRVFLANASDATVASLQSMPGIAKVLTATAPAQNLPQLDQAEKLFVEAWLSTRGQVKQRRGEGEDWDTPPMLPPDPKR